MTDAGQDAEFAAFVSSAWPRLVRIAYLMGGNWHQAEDLVQVILGRLYPHWSRVSAGGDPHAYVRRALMNALTDERRRPWRRERSVAKINDEWLMIHHAPKSPDANTAAVIHALDQLPPRQRAVIILRYLEDMPVTAVAAELEIAEGTVKSQAARGLETLRKKLLGQFPNSNAATSPTEGKRR